MRATWGLRYRSLFRREVQRVTSNDLPDIPLDQPLSPPARKFARPEAVAPAPRWVGHLYLTLFVGIIPWVIYLGFAPPSELGGGHWRVAWVGLDIMEAVGLALTARLAYRRSTWVDIAATATAILLIVDAWFDIVTSSGWELTQAIAGAVVLEIPLAMLSLWIARHAQVVNEVVTRWLIDRSSTQAECLHQALEMGFIGGGENRELQDVLPQVSPQSH
jgi:hypothetical protein